MASSSKRQTTMAKRDREQAVREKRVRKQQKKEERKRLAALGIVETTDAPEEGDEAALDSTLGTTPDAAADEIA